MAHHRGNGETSAKEWRLHIGEEDVILIPNMRACVVYLRKQTPRAASTARQMKLDADKLEVSAARIQREHRIFLAQLAESGTMDATMLKAHSRLEDECVKIMIKYGF